MNDTFTDTTYPNADSLYMVLSYIPLFLITIGVIGNSTAFAFFRFHQELKNMTCMVYFSFICITDTLSLFTWNLDHYTNTNFKVVLEYINEFTCKVFLFNQFFSLQSSALLLSMVSIDRYFTIILRPGSFASKLPFGTPITAWYWSLIILLSVSIINIHVLVMPRVHTIKIINKLVFVNSTFNITEINHKESFNCLVYTSGFKTYPNWENIHLVIYNCIPFCIMTVFNGLLIKNILIEHKKSKSNKSNKSTRKKHVLTLSLVFVTVSFLLMTFPNSIMYGFFIEYFFETLNRQKIIILSDHISFFNQCSIFFSTLLTNPKFRKIVSKILHFDRILIFRSNKVRNYPNNSLFESNTNTFK